MLRTRTYGWDAIDAGDVAPGCRDDLDAKPHHMPVILLTPKLNGAEVARRRETGDARMRGRDVPRAPERRKSDLVHGVEVLWRRAIVAVVAARYDRATTANHLRP